MDREPGTDGVTIAEFAVILAVIAIAAVLTLLALGTL